MTIIQDLTSFINPGQTPVLAIDQPLFALAKRLQWNEQTPFTDDNFVIMMSGLQIEKAYLILIGDWLQDSGWTGALVPSEVTTASKAESMIKASHVMRTMHVHQVTACCLYMLQQQSHAAYKSALPTNEDVKEFKVRCEDESREYLQFQSWNIALKLELLVVQFVPSLRQGNFELY